MDQKVFFLFVCFAILPALFTVMHGVKAAEDPAVPTAESTLKAEAIPSKTDDEVIQREEDTITAEGFSVHDQKLLREKAEKHEFQASVASLMKIIVNSLYSNREVFLREVISNASDALDKIRFLSIQDPRQLDGASTLEIKIKADPKTRSLHIIDSGIGMTKEELVKNLGTIAQSGTAAFLENYKKNGDLGLIGQFGVGFYSVFLVADTVTVATKHNDSQHQYVWQSDSKGSFTVSEDPRGNTLGRGTQLTLHLKEDAEEFLDENTLRNLVKKYSEFITFPIKLWTSHEEEKEVPLTPEEIAAEKEKEAKEKKDTEEEEVSLDEEKKDEEKKEEEEEKPKTKKVKETVFDWELMNQTKPLWARSPKDITEEEYHSFYKSFTKDYQDPLYYTHFNAEGEVEFKSLLFIPATAPNNMFDPNNPEVGKAIKLFVKRVFITDEFKDILPKYLNFIKGLVDSDDLPLNVSREMLQEHKILKVIKKKLVRKAIAMVQELAEGKKASDEGKEVDEEKKESPKEPNKKYQDFWKNFGTNIKLGIIEDAANRARLSKLLLFHSSKTKNLTSLADYVSRMKEGQTQIYYLAGENKEAVETSPLIERLVKKGYEVLYMVDAIDEYALGNLEKFDGKYKLTNISKEGLTLDGEEADEEKEKEEKEKFSKLIDFLKNTLGNKVEKVVISKRLTTSPSALVSGSYGWTANMERIIKAQALGSKQDYSMYAPKKTLEINPRHPLLKELLKRVESGEEEQTATDIAVLMYETALLASGFSLDDTSDFASRITRMMHLSLNIDPAAQAEEEPEPAPKQAEEKKVEEEPEVVEATNTKDEL